VLALPFVVLIAVRRGYGVRVLLFWLPPYVALAGALAYARAGFDTGHGVPGYPRDLQYHGLSTAWTVLGLALVAHGLLGAARPRQLLAVPATVFLLVPLVFSPAPGPATQSVTLAHGDLVRAYAKGLARLHPPAFVVDGPVPFVVPQFGKYAGTAGAAAVLAPGAPVLWGGVAYRFDGAGRLRRIPDGTVLPVTPSGTGYPTTTASTPTRGGSSRSRCPRSRPGPSCGCPTG
jgi:hypothetical protein